MDILNASLKEVLRVHPIAPLLERKALRDHQIGDMKILAGTILETMWIFNHYNEMYWENPTKFDPMRWLDQKNNEKLRQASFIYLPFSGGPRNCIGQHLAMIEIKVIVINILSRFNVSIENLGEMKVGYQQGLGLRPSPVNLILTPRI